MKQFRKNLFLASVFIAALFVFAWLRWDPAPWFNAQLRTHGLSRYVQVAQVEKSGLGLRLNRVHIQLPRGPNINLDRLQFNPAWFLIIRGMPALHVWGTAGDVTFAVNVLMRNGAIWLHEMDIRAQAGMIRGYFPQAAMLNLAGGILVSGKMELRQSDGLPLAGAVTVQWKNAASGLLGRAPLGDFQLQLTSSAKNEWRWKIEGGKMLSIDGSGHLSTASRNPAQWKVDGNIHAQSRGKVASLLSGMTGRDRWKFGLSGNVSRPRLKFLTP